MQKHTRALPYAYHYVAYLRRNCLPLPRRQCLILVDHLERLRHAGRSRLIVHDPDGIFDETLLRYARFLVDDMHPVAILTRRRVPRQFFARSPMLPRLPGESRSRIDRRVRNATPRSSRSFRGHTYSAGLILEAHRFSRRPPQHGGSVFNRPENFRKNYPYTEEGFSIHYGHLMGALDLMTPFIISGNIRPMGKRRQLKLPGEFQNLIHRAREGLDPRFRLVDTTLPTDTEKGTETGMEERFSIAPSTRDCNDLIHFRYLKPRIYLKESHPLPTATLS